MIFAFSGNRFLIEEALRETLGSRGLSARDLPRLAGEELNAAALEPHLQGGLFGAARVIVDVEGQKTLKDVLELISQTDAEVFVLDPSGPPTRVKVYEKHGQHHALATPTRAGDVTAWIQARAKKQKLSLERDAAARLAEIFGEDLAGIASELSKLEIIADGKISAADIDRLVQLKPPGDSFAMLEAATHHNTKAAFEQLGRLLHSGEDPFKIMGAVVWQYQLIARCVALQQRDPRVSENSAAQTLGVKPYPAKKALEVARKLNETQVRNQLERILAADFAMKSGGDPQMALEQLLLELSVG